MSGEKRIVRAVSAEPPVSKHLNAIGCMRGLPVSGNFELTARCNFDCKMCYVHLQNSKELLERELTAEQWLSLASDARDMGMIFLLLTGGEPFLRKDFPEIYTELIKMGMMISINTNASLYDEQIRSLFRKYPPTRLNVTLYGGTEETYESLCGRASFNKVVSNLKKMKEDHLQVKLNVSLTPYNISDMEKIHEISKELGLQTKATSYMYPPVRVTGEIGTNTARFDAKKAGKVMAEWSRLRDTKEMFLKGAEKVRKCQCADMSESCIDVEQEGIMCRAGRSSFWLTWDGRMLPCGTMDAKPAYPLLDGFSNAWQKTREYASEIRLPKKCAACSYRQNCGVCAANCKAETGHFDKVPEYLCQMTESQCTRMIEIAETL